ncbi:MAG: MaoC family dehydratase [Chloroflexi bacterium]|nr:MaoC family dehydratase [Chloroflexota bacterium]
MTVQKLEYRQLEVGQQFPAVSFNLDSDSLAAYLKSTGELDSLYEGTGIVPPTAVAAWALISLLEHVALPEGTIHLSQELQCLSMATEGDTLNCRARVSRKQERGRLRLLDIEFDVVGKEGTLLISGKSSFNFP